jgi:DNA mismatch repair protein MutS
MEGGADKSYGIQVARLAGLPQSVIDRAKEVLANLERAEFNDLGEPVAATKIETGAWGNGKRGEKGLPERKTDQGAAIEPQLGLFATEAGLLFKEIADLNLDAMTPLDALNKLHELKKRVEDGA